MTVLAPLALLGLLAIPLIIFLHLLHTRRQPLLVSNLRLWQGLQQKQKGDLPRRFPLSLLLLLQLCIAAALALALARPALSFLLAQPQHTIFILDTSTSMAAEDAGQLTANRRFDVARQTIQDHVQTMGENDTVVVIGLNRRPQILLTTDAAQKGQALLDLDKLTPGATGLDLPAALTLVNGLLDPNKENHLIILTDGNFTINADTLPPMKIPATWQFVPAQANTANQALLNVSARPWADGRYQLFARVVNYSEDSVLRTVRVVVDGRAANETPVELGPQAEIAKAWTLPASAQTVVVEIVEPDALPLDNWAELLLTGSTSLPVLLVTDAPEPQELALFRALQAQTGVELTVVDTAAGLNRHNPANFALLVFAGLPPTLTAWPEGNVLVVNPALGHPLLPGHNPVSELRPDPATASSLLTGIDVSGVYFNQAPYLTLPDWTEADLMSAPLTEDNLAEQNMAQASERIPLIFHGAVGNTRLVVWAFDLAASNLPGRLALPLLTANTLSHLLSVLPSSVVALGEPILLGQNLSVELPDGHRLVSPAQAGEDGRVFAQTKQPGLYKVYNEDDRLLGGFAVHAGSALESNLTTRVEPETLLNVDPAMAAIEPETAYHEFWPWLAGLALAIVALEGWLAWRR
ncbi:MAG: VWA domain-containing protein [Anaerolineae bacterium]|nr:VWA domain-containing protein [Anaerolineae bacterium]